MALQHFQKQRTVPLAVIVMGSVFWHTKGCVLVGFLLKGKTISIDYYIQTLKKL
jgi:hypothetical protein